MLTRKERGRGRQAGREGERMSEMCLHMGPWQELGAGDLAQVSPAYDRKSITWAITAASEGVLLAGNWNLEEI